MVRLNIPMDQRRCIYCKSNQTYIDTKGINRWHNIDNKACCDRCYKKYFSDPKRLYYKYRVIYIKEKNLTGKCNVCKKSIGDTYINAHGKLAIIKRTHTHHIKYNDHNILKDTIEICASCHAKITNSKRKKESYLHIKMPMNKRICNFCGSKRTYIKKSKKYPLWCMINDKLSCKKCYNKYYYLKHKNKEKKLLVNIPKLL